MKKTILLFITLLAISCNKQKQEEDIQDDYSVEGINKKITQNKPFFDFDEVVHYEFPLSETEFLNLMQTKIGGMPIDKDIVKYTKKIPVEVSKYKEFMNNIE